MKTYALIFCFAGCARDPLVTERPADEDDVEVVDTGILPPPPGPRARVAIPVGPFCVGSIQDILRPDRGYLSQPTTNPTLTVTFKKCDGSAFSTTKACAVRVGSYASFGAVRVHFTWPQGSTQEQVTWPVWPSPADFTAAPAGSEKTFHLTCDDGAAIAHWRQEGPLTVRRH